MLFNYTCVHCICVTLLLWYNGSITKSRKETSWKGSKTTSYKVSNKLNSHHLHLITTLSIHFTVFHLAMRSESTQCTLIQKPLSWIHMHSLSHLCLLLINIKMSLWCVSAPCWSLFSTAGHNAPRAHLCIFLFLGGCLWFRASQNKRIRLLESSKKSAAITFPSCCHQFPSWIRPKWCKLLSPIVLFLLF